MEFVYIRISHPSGMSKCEVLTRARKLIPCRTGAWGEDDSCVDWREGNLELEDGFYDKNPEVEYGPDDSGLKVTWESNDFFFEEEDQSSSPSPSMI